MTENLGQSFEIVFPGVNIKKYPCCYYTHSVIDVLVSVAKKHNLLPQDIKCIRYGIHEIANKTLIHRSPASGFEGKFKLPSCLTVTLLKEDVKIEDFQDVAVQDENIKESIEKVEIYVHPDLKGKDTQNSVVLDIETKGDRKY